MTNKRIVVWAGEQTIYAIHEIKPHTSVKSFLDGVVKDLRIDFGDGVRLNKVDDNQYTVDIEDVYSHA